MYLLFSFGANCPACGSPREEERLGEVALPKRCFPGKLCPWVGSEQAEVVEEAAELSWTIAQEAGD